MDLASDVIFADGQDNMGGIKKLAYIGVVGDFITISVPVPGDTDYGSTVIIATPHVLAPTKKTIALYVMYDKSGIEAASAGGRKQKSFKTKVTLMYPGNDAEIIGLLNIIKNSDVIILAEPQNPEDGDYIQIGTADLPASLDTASIKTGNAPDGEKGVTLEFTAPSSAGWYVYNAEVPRLGASS
ncbi:hypothetical protein [Mucilaginibacter sp.]